MKFFLDLFKTHKPSGIKLGFKVPCNAPVRAVWVRTITCELCNEWLGF